jgi:hypothetical protein
MAVRQQQRRGTAAQWTSANPILAAGEIGFETNTNKFKIGDGTNRWATLTYFTADAAAAIQDLIDGAPGILDTLNELAAAVGDDANFFATVTSNIAAAKSEAISTASADATSKSATAKSEAIATASSDATTKANNAKSGAEATAATALSAHEADTTNIHGIADTAALATKAYADTAEADAITAAGTAADSKIATAVAALTKSSVGLGNVDNTSDANKPVSTAAQTALDLKAPLASPGLTGTPTAPTAAVGTNTTQVATTAFVKAAIEDISSLNLVLDGGGV